MSYPTTSSVSTTSSAQTNLQAAQVPSYANEHDPSWEEVISMVVIPGQPGQIRVGVGQARTEAAHGVRGPDHHRQAEFGHRRLHLVHGVADPAARHQIAG